MKYLRKFETEADVQMLVQPNVVLVADTESVMFNVPMPNGAYIQHIDGNLYTTDQWTANGFANDEANGVAVIGTKAKFVIAKTFYTYEKWSSDVTNEVQGVKATTSVDTAKTNYSGAANTTLIAVDDTSGAAYKCTNFVFPNGANGYLPALGEWNEAYAYKADIDAAMTLIGGKAFGSSTHWSSTQYDADDAWGLRWSDGNNSIVSKNVNCHARAFTALNI